jgi:hypothetical protein
MTNDKALKSKISQFSQSSLQDYEQCPQRFKLRYLEQQRWPAIESEPVAEAERLARLGADFHRLVHQHLIGLDEQLLAESLAAAEPDLRRWWDSYLSHRPPQLAEAVALHPELKLSASLRGYLLLARFDALAQLSDGTFLIIDWKTTHRKPDRDTLERRLQTRVYPWLLAQAGAAFNGGTPIPPESISMLYWYPEFPAEAELFSYSKLSFQNNDSILNELLSRIEHAARHDDFPLTDDSHRCRYCVYRSLCERGAAAGPLLDTGDDPEPSAGDDLDLSLDWEQIAAVQY